MKTIKADTSLQYFDRGSACNAGALEMNQNTSRSTTSRSARRWPTPSTARRSSTRSSVTPASSSRTGRLRAPSSPRTRPPELRSGEGQGPDRRVRGDRPRFDFWYPSDVTRPYMPDPKGEFEAIQQRPRGRRLQAEPADLHLEPRLPDAANAGQVPDVPHRLELRLARHRQLPATRRSSATSGGKPNAASSRTRTTR